MGWHCSDTAHLHFDGVRVPSANIIGSENEGFPALMANFNTERLMLAAQAEALGRACFEEALEWAQTRRTFGKRLVDHQVVRHSLVDMVSRLNAMRAMLLATARAADAGEAPVAEICQLKNVATDDLEKVASAAVQILGGMGYAVSALCTASLLAPS